MAEFSLSSLKRIAKKTGIKRVTPEAAKELGRILEQVAEEICKEAMMIMMHSKRKTLFHEDVKAAARILNRRRSPMKEER